jgi:hypothetical protein
MADERPVCFLIAPIGDEGTDVRKRSDRVLKYLIEPAAEQCGYQVLRADKISKPGIITVQVIQQVINAPMVVADLTGHNANAFYELAIRHMVKKPLVQMIRKGEKVPFDVAATRVLFIEDPDLDTIEETKVQLVEHLKAAKNDASQVDNPISVSTDLQALRQSGDPVSAQLAEIAATLSADLAAIRADVADLIKDRENAMRAASLLAAGSTGGFSVGQALGPQGSTSTLSEIAKIAISALSPPPRYNVRSESEDDKPFGNKDR